MKQLTASRKKPTQKVGTSRKRVDGERFDSERGQAMTEYIALIVLVALVCLPIAKLLPAAIREYVRPFYYCVSRPIP